MTASPGADVIRRGVARFLAAELQGLPELQEPAPAPPAGVPPPVHIAAIGTTAGKAVHGELLADAIAAAGFQRESATAWADPDELFADPRWQLGVVLSPWKQAIGVRCTILSPSAQSTEVVDSVLRHPTGTVGFNTNKWSALSALEVLAGGVVPAEVVIIGSGASARSVASAVSGAWPQCGLVFAARSPASAAALAETFGGAVLDDAGSARSQAGVRVAVNTTTWGETEASEAEPFAVDLQNVLVPGGRLFDLNNRISALQHQALAAGCAVMSGAVMQRVTNACRAALLHHASQ